MTVAIPLFVIVLSFSGSLSLCLFSCGQWQYSLALVRCPKSLGSNSVCMETALTHSNSRPCNSAPRSSPKPAVADLHAWMEVHCSGRLRDKPRRLHQLGQLFGTHPLVLRNVNSHFASCSMQLSPPNFCSIFVRRRRNHRLSLGSPKLISQYVQRNKALVVDCGRFHHVGPALRDMHSSFEQHKAEAIRFLEGSMI